MPDPSPALRSSAALHAFAAQPSSARIRSTVVAVAAVLVLSSILPLSGVAQDMRGWMPPPLPAFQEAFPDLRTELEERIAQHPGVVGMVVLDPQTGEGISIRGDESFPSASMIKIAVLYELMLRVEAGDMGLDDPLGMLALDRAPGAGILRHFAAPAQVSVRNAALLMMAMSDNTATNLIIGKLGARAVTDRMDVMGLPRTRLFRKVFGTAEESFDREGSELWGFGVTTPMELAVLLTWIERGEAVSPEASAEMLRMLEAQQHRVGIPRLLPAGTRVAHKTGSISAARHDCGVVFGSERTFTLCIMTRENEDTRYAWNNEGEMLQGELARIVFDALNSG